MRIGGCDDANQLVVTVVGDHDFAMVGFEIGELRPGAETHTRVAFIQRVG